jgi:hypothetical protein
MCNTARIYCVNVDGTLASPGIRKTFTKASLKFLFNIIYSARKKCVCVYVYIYINK